MTPIASVVIPAHDEAAVLGESLDALLRDARAGELDVVVVANACTDATAEIARARGVAVVETEVPGKPHAIRLGDVRCRVFPRVYLDADVRFDTADLRRVVDRLASSGAAGGAPTPRWDLADVGPLARRLHRVHEALVGPRRGLAGAGVYVLSERGHRQVFPMPDVISDDGWVHRSLGPDRVVVADARSTVRPAPTVASALRRRTRLRRGNAELAAWLGPVETPLRLSDLRPPLRERTVGVVDTAVYLGVVAADRVGTRMAARRRPAGEPGWATARGR